MNISAARHRRIRAALLALLKTEHPASLDVKALQFAADNLGYPMTEAMVEAHLKYLEEKGFVRVHRRKGKGFNLAFAELTATGWDLLDGLGHDKGVDGIL